MQELEAFVDALFEHIHLENNLLFPALRTLNGKSYVDSLILERRNKDVAHAGKYAPHFINQ